MGNNSLSFYKEMHFNLLSEGHKVCDRELRSVKGFTVFLIIFITTILVCTQGYGQRIKVQARVFLEGPFNENTSVMEANLKLDSLVSNGLIPGAPTTLLVPTLFTRGYNAVDAVRLMLVKPDFTRIDSIYAWVAEDGYLYDIFSGLTRSITFNNAPEGNYYLEVKHRNHLSVMYRVPISFLYTTTLFFDFTKISNVYNNGAIMLNATQCGMIAGNAIVDGRGEVNASDLYAVSKDSDNLREGYLLTDVDLNGVVNAVDRQITLEHNLKLYNSKVP